MLESEYVKVSNKARLAEARNILANVMNNKEYGIKDPRKFKDAFNAICELGESFELNITEDK